MNARIQSFLRDGIRASSALSPPFRRGARGRARAQDFNTLSTVGNNEPAGIWSTAPACYACSQVATPHRTPPAANPVSTGNSRCRWLYRHRKQSNRAKVQPTARTEISGSA